MVEKIINNILNEEIKMEVFYGKLKKLYYRIFPTYKILERKCYSYPEAEKMLRENCFKIESEQWTLAPEEDANKCLGFVYLCRKERK